MSIQTQHTDTIAAIATATGGGVGIVRVSGKNLLPLAQEICHKQNISPRKAEFCSFFDDQNEVLDQGLLLFFPAPHSFTGEDVIELHGHGGSVVLNLLLQRVLQLGARMAEAGEFSRRAFLNGKMDLVEVESVADLIAASGEKAARMAARSLQGVFSKKINGLLRKLIDLRMLVEAVMDFPEEDEDFLQNANITKQIKDLKAEIEAIFATARQGAVLREGLHIVLVGAPNVGKSSLLNALSGEDTAIVTDIAGTTRDMVREQILIDGVPVFITDTAGLRQTTDIIEQKGIERGLSTAKNADAVLILSESKQALSAETAQLLADIPQEIQRIFVENKIDKTGEEPELLNNNNEIKIKLSAKTGAGLNLLKQVLLDIVGSTPNDEGLFLARTRHLEALQQAMNELDNALIYIQQNDLLAEHLRHTQNELGKITGEFSPDDLLGEIFSRFCIGK
ncbi:MAG: tRNA uridine-5-carboxymethylaminomethyl(34) synthesis GTPase MnmE [Neisseriaceae bacterium]|nr:tRNA uridine-5-carboxymethylaminomethyl(34) synthesis GTPase MnmE [Neisseriaceae bacterium]